MRLWPRSLTARILLVEVLAILVVLLLVPTLMISLLHQSVAHYQDRLLLSQASEVAAGLRADRGAVKVVLPGSLEEIYASAYDGRAYVVADSGGRIVAASRGAEREAVSHARLVGRTHLFRAPPFVGVSLPTLRDGRHYWVIVSQNEARPGAILDDVVNAFLRRSVFAIVAVLILLPLINSLFIRRLINAIRRTSGEAETIGPETLDRRLPETDLPAEVLPLVHATNVLIGRLQRSLDQQREFAGNVAHELRTPLATLQVQLDAIDDEAVRKNLKETVADLSHVISQLADLAAVESLEKEKRVDFDLNTLVQEVVGELAPQIYASGDEIGVRTAAEPAIVQGEPMLTRLALANLVSNANRHTPRGTRISVNVESDGSVCVSDNGPGVSRECGDQVLQRFWRADRRRSDTAGLGLSIVQRILQVQGGRLEMESEPGRGASFRIRLPLSPPSNG